MNTLDPFLDITALDALRFVYECGPIPTTTTTTATNTREGGAEKDEEKTKASEGKRSPSAEPNTNPLATNDEASSTTTSTDEAEPQSGSVSRLPGLWRVIESQLHFESETAVSHRTKHSRRRSSAASSSAGVRTPHGIASLVMPLSRSAPTSVSAMSTRTEYLAAVSQVSAELVFRVLDQVVYDPATAVQRYEEALMHFILNSTLAPKTATAPKLSIMPSSNSDSDTMSGASNRSQYPHSPRGFGELSFPEDPGSPNSRDSKLPSPAALRRERRMLLSRYETCCEVMGMMALSSVVDRLAGLDGGALSSLDSSAQDLSEVFQGPLTNTSSPTVPYGNMSVTDWRDTDDVQDNGASNRTSAPQPHGTAAATSSTRSGRPEKTEITTTLLSVPPPPRNDTNSPRPLSRCSTTTEDILPTTEAVVSTSEPSGSAQLSRAHSGSASHLTNAHAINLCDCEGLGRAESLLPVFGMLEGFPQATFLGVAGVGLTDAGATVLALLGEAHLPNLRALDVSRNPQVTDMSTAPLHRLVRRRKTLCSIMLEGTSLSLLPRTTIEARVRRNAREQEASASNNVSISAS